MFIGKCPGQLDINMLHAKPLGHFVCTFKVGPFDWVNNLIVWRFILISLRKFVYKMDLYTYNNYELSLFY